MAGREFKVKKGLVVYSEGVDDVVLDVQGSQGQLFSVTDRLTGLLHSVNDISGVPIMEVYSDDRILMGTYGAVGAEISGSVFRLPNAPTASAYSGILVLENGDVKTASDISIIGGEPAFTKGSLIQGSGITLSGTLTNRLVGSGDVTVTHTDTSSQTSVSNTNGTVIQSVTLDNFGHVTALASTNLDTRYSLTSHNHTLDSLSNVTITSNTNGEILRWNGSAWINNTLAEAGIQPELDIISLAELNTGTSTTERSVNAKNLNDWLSGVLSGANGYTEESLTYVASNTFTLSQANPMAINVYIHGQRKRPGLDYTVSGNQITFLDTLQASFDIKVTYFYSIPGIGLSGGGTTNYIPKWNSTTSFTDSQIFDNGTNVGIGTNSPTDKLSVQDGSITSTDATGTNYAKLDRFSGLTLKGNGAGSRGIQTPNTDALTLGTSNTERMRITSGGNVGIGATDPNAKFEIRLGAAGEYMRVGGDDANGGRALRFTSSTDGSVGNVHTINASSILGVIALATASTERMRITSDGNVLIGTTFNDGTKLRVVGITNSDTIYAGGQITSSAAKLQVNGFMRTGTIYLHAGDSPPAATNQPLSNVGGDLHWNSLKVFHDGYHPNADTWTTARTLTIGSTGKSVNGSANVTWSLAEIGAAATSHTHPASDITAGTFAAGDFTFQNALQVNGNNIRFASAKRTVLHNGHMYMGDIDNIGGNLYIRQAGIDVATISGYNWTLPYDLTVNGRITEVKGKLNTFYNNLGAPMLEEYALIHGQMNNKLRFISPALQEESTDGITWTTSTRASADQLGNMMRGEGEGTSFSAIPAPALGGTGYYRLTWNANQTSYVFLNKLYIYCSTSGNQVEFTIERKHNTDGWQTLTSGTLSNWPGHVFCPHTSTAFHPTATTLYGEVRVTFRIVSAAYTNPFTLYAIEWLGGYPAGKRNVESYDRDKNVSFPAAISGTRLISTIATGTAPLTVTSTTRVANLNVATAGTSDTWTTARTITIGSTGKSVNGSANVSWSLAEIGAQAAGNYVTTDTTQTITGEKTFTNEQMTLSGHFYRNIYTPSTTAVYDHYYPSGGNGSNVSIANLRVWNGSTSYKALIFSGGGSFTWDGNAVFHDGYHPNADTLTTARTINGTSFNGSANITTSTWGTARNITIGSTTRSVDGSTTYTWTLTDIGAAATSHTHTLDSLSNVTITTPSNGEVLQYNGTAWVNATPSGGGTITGSGTTNYITKWTGSTAIGNSLIYDNGTQVLVNTTTATGETFEVNGTARIKGAYIALNTTVNDGGKIRLIGSSSEYAIGSASSVTFGAINNNTVVNFTMPNNTAMGWRWYRTGHTAAQGTMALSTNGYLTVASGIRIGYGESDTTVPTIPLDVNGNVAIQGQIYSPAVAKGNSGTAVTFNWNDGNIQTVTMTGNATFTFSNPQSGASYQIIIDQDATGSRTITWPTIKWAGGSAPSLTGTANSRDIVTLTYDGTSYNGVITKGHA